MNSKPWLHRSAATLTACFFMVLAQTSMGQMPENIYVSIQLDEKVGRGLSAETQSGIVDDIIEFLEEGKFHHRFRWDFEPSPEQEPTTPRLEISVVEDNFKLIISSELWLPEGSSAGHVTKIVRSDVQVQGIPGPSQMRGAILEWFEEQFFADRGDALQHILKNAPIGVGVVLTSDQSPNELDEALGIILLPFEEFEGLTMSTFRFLCPRERQGKIELISKPNKDAMDYQPRAAEAPVRSIVVRHTKYEGEDLEKTHLEKLASLMRAFVSGQVQLAQVYLDEYVEYFSLGTEIDEPLVAL